MNRRVLALVVGTMLVMSVGVMPVAGGTHAAAHATSPLCDAHDASAELKAGRGSKVREKDTGQVHADLPARAKGKAPANFSVTVPVYFHVITDGSDGDLTDSQIHRFLAFAIVSFGDAVDVDDVTVSFRRHQGLLGRA